jgi:hypothetical protein
MKKTFISFCLLVISLSYYIPASSAQPSKTINYQAVARNSAGNIIANQNISVRITIEDAAQAALYTEIHGPVTNQFGLFTLPVGDGGVVFGNYAAIDWSAGDHYLKVEMDPTGGNSYVNMGTSMLLSVPYANYAASGGTTYTPGTGISLTGNIVTNTAPDQVVTLAATGATTITGTYPNFTINAPASVNFRRAKTTTSSYFSFFTRVSWDSSVYINNCTFSGDSAFIAPSAGLYHFDFSATFDNFSTGSDAIFRMAVFVNTDTAAYRIDNALRDNNAVPRYVASYSDNLQLQSGDKVFIMLRCDNAFLNLYGGNKSSFSGYKINY